MRAGPRVAVSVPSVAISAFAIGTLADLTSEAVEIELDETFDCPSGALAFVHLGVGSPSRAEGEVVEIKARRMAVKLTSVWQPIDQREFPRHRLCVPVFLESLTDAPGAIGVLVDVSLGGAAIEVSCWDHDRLTFKVQGSEDALECDVIDQRPAGGASLLHCRFVDPDANVTALLPQSA